MYLFLGGGVLSARELRRALRLEATDQGRRDILNRHLDLLHLLWDNRFEAPRFFAGLLPTLGFVGTVVGLSQAFAVTSSGAETAGERLAALSAAGGSLATAFDTTLVGLVLSIPLVWLIIVGQRRAARAIADAVTDAEGLLRTSSMHCVRPCGGW